MFLIASNDWAVAVPHYHPMEDAIAGKDVQRGESFSLFSRFRNYHCCEYCKKRIALHCTHSSVPDRNNTTELFNRPEKISTSADFVHLLVFYCKFNIVIIVQH